MDHDTMTQMHDGYVTGSANRPAGASLVAPIAGDERLHTLDILRGLALFGMILVHFHQKMRIEVRGVEGLIGWGVYVLVEQKAWGTFAFLFGAGFALAGRRLTGASLDALYLRRLLALAAFGVIATVGFGFHILFEYAMWGLALLLIRRWTTRTLIAAAIVSAAAGPIAAELIALHSWWTAAAPGARIDLTLRQAVDAAASQDSYRLLLYARARLFVSTLPHTWRAFVPDSNLALFILGLLAVRHRILDDPGRQARIIRGWMIFGASAWALAWLVLPRLPEVAIAGADWPIKFGFGLIQDQWLCFTYIGAVLLLLARRPQWTARLWWIGLAGRMALTNYMLQAAMLDVLSSGYGFALRLRPYAYVPAALLLFGIEVFVSWFWLSRYRFGPLEWLWRTATYAELQPLGRRRPAGIRVEGV